MTQSNSLETFDLIELLALLSRGKKTGALHIVRGEQEFILWLSDGRVRRMQGPDQEGPAAFAELLDDHRGRFHFEADEEAPPPTGDTGHEAFAYAALKLRPAPPLKFEGAGRLEPQERLAELPLSLYEEEVLRGVAEGQHLSDLARDPEAAALLGRLSRLRLIAERRTRVARLSVQVSRQAAGAALLDDLIYRRWRDSLGFHIERVQVRDERSGKVHLVLVRPETGIGNALLLPPELLIHTGLRAGDSVLVKPA